MEETLRNGDKIELIAKKVGELFGNEKKDTVRKGCCRLCLWHQSYV